ncbi:S-adenosyl-L-methionine-dependent methyltransferase [Mycolicibacterium novocastrense]|uniref:YceI family protein n=1 Tax=Mycolicibacterium novocastrense TaxID=59813 RepID=UPI0007460BD9|nr:YceI family protein [Mycolicibacterium novocastrense]KUH67830.1 S-adenosyl-L-methionine-dependent methyltransferase [Mycolicibacterium novocastrense]KUH68303.1 S-adenosyl-L-methionine-dependent methyltransferase [Mycolicibacterium novocastrense]KUH73382.1 S-adenosyl-L-methionine-dependent methyltransferase [Mycolicibacterium novocastrense]
MNAQTWTMDESEGRLEIRTGVEGRAAKMGHRLTIALNSWHATVGWSDGEPAEVALTVEVDSLEVLSGEGGVTPLTGPEKALARSNALKVLNAKRFPRIEFETRDIKKIEDGYRLTGTLQINGKTRDQVVDVIVQDLDDVWRMSCETTVRHSDFGLKPYSMLMGAMKVADAVTVAFTAERNNR